MKIQIFKRKFSFILTFICSFLLVNAAFAQRVPLNVQNFVNSNFKDTYFRYDGLVILPDNTVYIPVIPAKFSSEDEELTVKMTIPENTDFSKKPDAVVLSNDFTLLKVLRDKDGSLSVLNQSSYPEEIKSGIFPQDLFLPRRITIPSGLENIKGNLESYDENIDNMKMYMHGNKDFYSMYFLNPQLKNCSIYVTTPISKNIKTFSPNKKKGYISYARKYSPNKIALYDNRFLLVTSYSKNSISVISLADDAVIKEIQLPSVPEEIIITENTAYVSSSQGHCIYEIDLNLMQPIHQIMVNGMCEKLVLSDDAGTLFYYDKQGKTIWAVELNNSYLLKDIGVYPNVSKIVNYENKLYITSRTRNLVAIIDYLEMNLLGEYKTGNKPVDIIISDNKVYILCAGEKLIKVLNINTDEFIDDIIIPAEGGFPSKFYQISGTNNIMIADSAKPAFYVLDAKTNKITGNYKVDEPIANFQVGKVLKKINEQ